MMKDVEQALLDFVDIFQELKIHYAVMGGLAVRAYGVPRPTYDVDINITVVRDRLNELYDAAENAGYTVPDAYRRGWVDEIAGMPLVKFRIYRPDRSVDVDVFLVETAYQRVIMDRRGQATLLDRDISIVSPEDLILLKVVAGRSRDLGDIEDVRFMLGDMDEAYMRYWAERLGVSEELETVLAKPPL
jgi:hypothetical protein